MVPAVTKKSADHYVVFKKVRDIWLSLDNTEVKKANMNGMSRVNLAFFRNINTSKCVEYNIDFVDIKQGRARRRPLLLVKSHPKYSGQKGKGKKSSAQPQLSIPDDPSKEFVGEGPILQNEVSAGGTAHIQPETSESTCPKNMSENASVALTSVDSHLQITDNEASEAEPGTVPTPQASSSNPSSASAADTAVRDSTEVQSVPGEKGTLPTVHDTVGTKSSEINKDSVNDKSQTNTHNEALHANPSEKHPSTFHDNPKAKGGCSAADMAPLEFKKRLFVDIEKYPNLLKRYQEGKVKVYVSCTEDERLNTIRQKVISKIAFNKYLSETVDETKNLQKPILSNTPADPDSSDDQSTGSSVEGDDSETDPDYNPAKEVDDEDTPSKAKKPKTTNEGNNTHFCSQILLKYSELLPSIILVVLEYFSSTGFLVFLPI